MIEIDFAGWFQCRLATDPDAFDDPRGELGWTFAMPGEPDLDRVIRFQGPVAPRSRCPAVGIAVTAVRLDGNALGSHPLVGQAVELVDNAVFEGRNGDIATSAQEPIVPFALRLQLGKATILARDPIDLTNPDEIARRQPINFLPNSPEVAAATGVTDRVLYRQQRREMLQMDLVSETDPTRRSALEKRIAELAKGSIRVTSLGFQLNYEFELRGPNEWTDPGHVLGDAPTPGNAWLNRFWMGGWDADMLGGYAMGTLRVS